MTFEIKFTIFGHKKLVKFEAASRDEAMRLFHRKIMDNITMDNVNFYDDGKPYEHFDKAKEEYRSEMGEPKISIVELSIHDTAEIVKFINFIPSNLLEEMKVKALQKEAYETVSLITQELNKRNDVSL
jgi:hypothetical protein